MDTKVNPSANNPFYISILYILLTATGLLLHSAGFGHTLLHQPSPFKYVVTMDEPQTHKYHVELTYQKSKADAVDFRMSAWTPGYYELMNFAETVENFKVKDANGKAVKWSKTDANTWHVDAHTGKVLKVSYEVKAENPFIGNVYLDENYGYIIPGGLLLYTNADLQHSVTLQIVPFKKWPVYIATGLNSLPGQPHTFLAANFDELFDSPLLMGNLEKLPDFRVKGIAHQFAGYHLEDFDRAQFMADLKKIVESGSRIIGEIPYNHYTFMATATPRGFGGIEHLNSASLMLSTRNLLSDPAKKESFYAFLAHEYFHTYNVKRIRPVELGPFDYSKENYTNMLWLSEGFTDYYEYLIIKSAGLTNAASVLEFYRQHIRNYENKPGHLLESAAQASHNLWVEDDVSKRSPEELAKTISVYDKGCAIALMLDLKIRHETGNKRSLDDVMQLLYNHYYKKLNRGFTEKEFWVACETIAGVPLTELAGYANTVKPVDYPKYFAYAGLVIDTANRTLPGGYLGTEVGNREGKLLVRSVDYPYPAWKAGLLSGDQILAVDGEPVNSESLNTLLQHKQPGDRIKIRFARNEQTREIIIPLSTKAEKSFNISRMSNCTALQEKIYNCWLRNSL